ncbi:MerR family transcriptional regulator [Mycetocola sp. 2940]|uniref:MerR family transcriptional regulator n=1 Tax=Mycetocola sp. 2940 TaxID=3156452 RepID=UPI0033931FA9
MKISEAAQAGGVSVSTFKYYQREGLVPAGIRLSGNQTAYDEPHVLRVRLVRALLETGGLSIGAAKAVVATLDSDDDSLAFTFEAAQHALGAISPPLTPASEKSRQSIEALAAAQGWLSTAENPGLDSAARVLDGFAAIGFAPTPEYLQAYAAAAASIARADVAALQSRDRPDLIAELMVVGTVLGDALVAGLRRLAHESVTAELFPVTAREPGSAADEPANPTPEHPTKES